MAKVQNLKTFQEEAVRQLRKQFLGLWKTSNRKLPLIFEAPTGSGKTVMVAQFLKDMSNDPQLVVDKSYLWFSFSEDSYRQSKGKLFDYYGGANELNLLDLNDLSKGKLEKNNVFFINWQKIKSSTKEGRKLRNPTEYTYGDEGIFDEFIKRTQADGRELILIIDEAHRDTDTELADELIDLINPRIILKITATPKIIPSASDVLQGRAGYVEVLREEVIKAGLIKEKIIMKIDKKMMWLYILSAAIYAMQGFEGLPGTAMFAYLKEHLHFSPEKIMYMGSIISIPWLIKPLFGFFIDQYLSKKLWIIISLLGSIAISLCFGLSPYLSIPFIIVISLLGNYFTATRDISNDGLACVEGKENDTCDIFQNVQWMSITIAGIIVSLAGGYIAEHFSYRFAYLCLIPIYLLIIGIVLRYKSRPSIHTEEESCISCKFALECTGDDNNICEGFKPMIKK